MFTVVTFHSLKNVKFSVVSYFWKKKKTQYGICQKDVSVPLGARRIFETRDCMCCFCIENTELLLIKY